MMISCITFIVRLHLRDVEYLQYVTTLGGRFVNRNSIFIGLFLAVFVFPTNNSLVFAKSCKDQKNDLRAEKKAEIQSVCEGEILPLLGQLTNHSRNREVNGHTNAGFCRGGDWSVSTNPKGGCGKQKDHIRSKYNNKIEALKAFVVDTENALEAQKRRAAEKAERKRLAAEKAAEEERLAAEKAEQERLAAEKAEQERLAEKAERKRLAAEKAAEEERLAAEKAERKRLAAEALRPKMLEAGIEAAYEVAKEMNRNWYKWDSWKTLDIRGRDPYNEAAYSALRVTVKSQEISASSESELLEAAVKEIVNRMNQEQLEAIEHEVCITASDHVYIQCAKFKKGYKR
jgi:hypothetical protein